MKLGNPNYLWQLMEARIEFDTKILRNAVVNKKLQLSFKRSGFRDRCLPMCNNLWQRCDLKALALPIILQRWLYAILFSRLQGYLLLDGTNKSFHVCHLFGGPLYNYSNACTHIHSRRTFTLTYIDSYIVCMHSFATLASTQQRTQIQPHAIKICHTEQLQCSDSLVQPDTHRIS